MRRNSWLINGLNRVSVLTTQLLSDVGCANQVQLGIRKITGVVGTQTGPANRGTPVTTLHIWRKRQKYGIRNRRRWRKRGSTEGNWQDCRKADKSTSLNFLVDALLILLVKLHRRLDKTLDFEGANLVTSWQFWVGSREKSIGQLLHLGGILVCLIAGAALWRNFDGNFAARAREARNNVEFAHELNVFCMDETNHGRPRYCWPLAGPPVFIPNSSQQSGVQGLET